MNICRIIFSPLMFILLFRVKVDNIAKVAEIELAEKEKMKDKVRFLKIT